MHPLGRTLLCLVSVLAAALLAGCGTTEPVSLPRANVVLVSIDTLRADHLSSYGYHRETSPFLDALAGEATRFANAYVHVPFTLKSHMSMLTSLFPAAHGVVPETSLSEAIPTLPQALDQAGYRTLGLYTLHWLDPEFGFSRGFDRYEFMDSGKAVRDAALALLLDLAADRARPFFLFLHLREVHCSPGLGEANKPLYDSPPEYRDAFLPFPEVTVDHLPRDIWDGKVRLSGQELANVIAQYDGGILYADSLVREIFAGLAEHGLDGDTLVVVTSDHGESLGARGDFSSHGSFWEEGLRVPLIVQLPDVHPEAERWRGVVVDDRVQSVDIAPTILGALGISIPETFQGQDLFDRQDRDVIADQGDGNVSILIRGRYKLALFLRDGKTETRLFDLAEDPGETTSIHLERPQLTAELTAALKAQVREHHAVFETLAAASTPEEVELDEAKQEQLRALGYLN